MLKQVICINWGTKYGPRYINRLYGMVARNITPPFTFTCFCDDPAGIRDEVRTEPLPPLDVEMPTGTLGIWPKARLWGPELADLEGPVVFFDLDLVITGNLDGFFEYGDPNGVVLSRNPTKPLERLGQTSLFRFPVGSLVELQNKFRADPQGVADTYRFEQRFVTQNAPGGVELFPAAWVRHFRRQCMRPFPINLFQPPRLPRDTRVVIFPGHLLPDDAIAGRYRKKNPHKPVAEHLGDALRKPGLRGKIDHMRHYMKPAPWVADAWRD